MIGSRKFLLLTSVLLLSSSLSLADRQTSNVTVTNTPFNGGAVGTAITAPGFVDNAPVTTAIGGIFAQQTTGTAPSTAQSLFRDVYWNDILTMPATGNSSGIHEKFFVETDSNWSGTFTQSGEYNEIHAYARDVDAGCTTPAVCIRSGRRGGFEFSGTNDINITGSVTPFYDAYVNNATGTINSYIAFQPGLVNNGTVGTYAVIDFNGVTGANQPTTTYSLLSRQATTLMDHVGPVVIGVLTTASLGAQLGIKGVGTGSGLNILVKDASNVNKFSVADNGNIVGSGELTGLTNIRGIQIGAGASAAGTFTTITTGGVANINNNVNAASNIGTGTSTGTVTIGGASNTLNIAAATVQSGGVAAVSCLAGTVNVLTLEITKGIVTHC